MSRKTLAPGREQLRRALAERQKRIAALVRITERWRLARVSATGGRER